MWGKLQLYELFCCKASAKIIWHERISAGSIYVIICSIKLRQDKKSGIIQLNTLFIQIHIFLTHEVHLVAEFNVFLVNEIAL